MPIHRLELYKKRFYNSLRVHGDCLIWKGSTNHGYGRIRWFGTRRRATHVAFYLSTGKWPNHQINHRCNNPLCCNPEHLYDGTHIENIQDMKNANHSTRGIRHPQAKLTWKQVRSIRRKYATGKYSLLQLANKYNLCKSNVSYIVNNRTWIE
jgi:hypothetical protein